MHYVVLMGGTERDVEINEIAPDRYQLTFDGHRIEVDGHPCGQSTWSLIADNSAFVVNIDAQDTGHTVHIAGHSLPVEVLDLRRMRLRRAQDTAAGQDGSATVTASMPGKVVAVLVQEGDTVTAGQGVMVIEAMKMENELRAPRAGVVRAVAAVVGAAVDSGATLCVIE